MSIQSSPRSFRSLRAAGADRRDRLTRGEQLRLSAVVTVLSALVFASACGSNSSPSTAAGSGTLAVQLTDAPFLTDSVRSVDVFVVRVDARVADADSANAAKGASDDSASTGGWTTIATPNQSVNLLAYQGGVTLALGQQAIPSGSYLGFRLVIDPTRSSVTLKNGLMMNATTTPSVMFPSGSRSGLKIVLSQPVSITANQTTTVLVDFLVANSFVMRGSSMAQNGLLFTPVIHASVK